MVLRVDADERKIGLSRKRAEGTDEEAEVVEEEAPVVTSTPTIKPENLKGGMGGDAGPLFKLPGQE
jgi:small subunit ribosomal protein S1